MRGYDGGCPQSDGYILKMHEFTEITTFSDRYLNHSFQVQMCTACGERQWRWNDFFEWEVLHPDDLDLYSTRYHASTVACPTCGGTGASGDGVLCCAS